jgi:Cu+-exporting ATPase
MISAPAVSAEAGFSVQIEGLRCASCVGKAERALRALPGISRADVNLATGAAAIEFDAAAAPTRAAQAVVAAIAQAGFKVVPVERQLALTGLHCASCVGKVEAALASQPGVLEADVNLATSRARIVLLDPSIDLAGPVRRAGYGAEEVGPDTGANRKARTNSQRAEMEALTRDVWLAAALSLPLFLVEMGGHLVPAFHMAIMGALGMGRLLVAELGLATLVLFGPGRRFFTAGLASLWRLSPDMNALVALGAGAAYLFSAFVTLWPRPAAGSNVYFEASGVIVTLILTGRLLEARARGRAGAAIERLAGLRPETAHRVTNTGAVLDVPAESLRAGDRVMVKPGERVPADGWVLEGESYVDESMLTGEANPVAKAIGAEVTGGSVNGSGSFVFIVERTGGDTVLARIIRMVETAQGTKLPVQALADRVTAWFVPAVMAIATVTFFVWLAVGATLGFALINAVGVLIISCPCAMGLATPVSIMVATGRAAELGILFRQGRALQLLGQVTLVAFDKTGTLTIGKPGLTACELQPGFSRDDVLALAAALEARSEHPVGAAIVAAARADGLALPDIETFAARPGLGIAGRAGGRDVLVGTARLMREAGVECLDRPGPGAAVFVAIGGQLAAVMSIADAIKPDAAAVIAALHAKHIATAMITGDSQTVASAVAGQLGIDQVVAGVLPGDKAAALKALPGGLRAFAGDGINDAPVLAAADVGIALGTGTDVAIEAADVVLMADRLDSVPRAIGLSRATMRNIKQNLFWAFAYNIVLIPVAAGVLHAPFGITLSPMLGAGAMAMSSVFVVTNALRLRRFGARACPEKVEDFFDRGHALTS